MKRHTRLRRIEGLEEGYLPKKSSVFRGTTLLTMEELQFICSVSTKCQQLDPADAKILGDAYYLLTGRRLPRGQNGDGCAQMQITSP